MQKDKGQAPIIFLVLALIGIVLLIKYFKPNLDITPSFVPSSQNGNATIPVQQSKPSSPNDNVKPVPDVLSPLRSNPQPSGGLSPNTRDVFLALNTNENATCRYATVSGVFYENMQNTFSGAGSTFHSALVTGLSEGQSYSYYVRCVDGQGNKNSDDFIISFWVNYPADVTPPGLSNAYPAGDVLRSDTSSVMIGVSTNEPASCRYSWTQGTSYDSMPNSLSPDNTSRYHTANITGLYAGNAYSYFVRCKDFSGNVNLGDVMISFRVDR